MKKLIVMWKMFLVVSLLLFPFVGRASCSFATGVTGEITKNINFGTIVVQRDAAIGSVLASVFTGAYNGGDSIYGCTTAWSNVWSLNQFTQLSSYGNNVYATNISGVGLRLTNIAHGAVIPYTESDFVANEFVIINSTGVEAELVKTSAGGVGAGNLTTGKLANASASVGAEYANVTLTGTNTIQPVACSVTNTSITVPMGTVLQAKFTGTGSTTDAQTFSIPLNCDSGTKVHITLSAGSSGSFSTTSGILNLDSSSGSTTATGVGLQLLYNSSPVTLGSLLNIATTSSSGSYSIPLTAQYYQTASTITAGTANASATFTMTYQ